MLWVSVHLPHLAMELRQPQQPGPAVVTDGTGARRRVIACNTAALQTVITIGMDAPSSMMREPDLHMLDRSKTDEKRAILAIASWAHQFTSEVYKKNTRKKERQKKNTSLWFFNCLTTLCAQIK